MVVDYSNGKIYKVIFPSNIKPYIGHTAQTLVERFSTHRYRYSNGIKNEIILIEDFPCETKYQLEVKERFWIEYYNKRGGTLNNNIPTRSKKEYNKIYGENNKERLNSISRLNYENNKDKEQKRSRLYHDNNKDKVKTRHSLYYNNNKEKVQTRHNLYYKNNKKQLSINSKLYRANNKDKEKIRHRLYDERKKFIKTLMNFPIRC